MSESITIRKSEIVALINGGFTRKEIATKLGITVAQVRAAAKQFGLRNSKPKGKGTNIVFIDDENPEAMETVVSVPEHVEESTTSYLNEFEG